MNASLRNIPKIDGILSDGRIAAFRERISERRILNAVREAVERARLDVISGTLDATRAELTERVINDAERELSLFWFSRLQKVINATGIITHTNLGRSVMPGAAAGRIAEIAAGFCNLEYDIVEGKRRNRLFYLERVICDLTGAEAAVVVNNNAAAVFIALNTLCRGKEALLSRGEVVEIGDSFRISSIILESGAVLTEVGATNRTYASDYQITESTGMILKIHTSNYQIEGYASSVPAAKLAAIGKEAGVPVLEDMGSGVLCDLTQFGLAYERQVSDAIAEGVDIVTFSGDKLLGGPQAGIIAGKRVYIDKIRKNQLMRCLRIDKLRIAALEAVFAGYYNSGGKPGVPVYDMLRADTKEKACKLLEILNGTNAGYDFQTAECPARFGGGSTPGQDIPSHGIVITSPVHSAAGIERFLRVRDLPVIATVKEDKVILNVMTIDPCDFDYIGEVFRA